MHLLLWIRTSFDDIGDYLTITALQGQNDKLLLAARKIRRATSNYFVISLTANDFSLASNTCIGKVRQVISYITLQNLHFTSCFSNSFLDLNQVKLSRNQVHGL